MNKTNRTLRTKGKCRVCGRPAILTENFCSVVCFHEDARMNLAILNEVTSLTNTDAISAPAGSSGGGPGRTSVQQPPEARSLSISGDLYTSGSATGSYTFYDVNGDAEGVSTYKWYSADDLAGTNKSDLGFTTTEIPISASEEDKYLIFEVTPVSVEGPAGSATDVYSNVTMSATP